MITDRTIKEITDAEQNWANNETLRSPSINRTLFRTFSIQNYNGRPNNLRLKIFDEIVDITSACEEDQHFKPYQKPLIYQVQSQFSRLSTSPLFTSFPDILHKDDLHSSSF